MWEHENLLSLTGTWTYYLLAMRQQYQPLSCYTLCGQIQTNKNAKKKLNEIHFSIRKLMFSIVNFFSCIKYFNLSEYCHNLNWWKCINFKIIKDFLHTVAASLTNIFFSLISHDESTADFWLLHIRRVAIQWHLNNTAPALPLLCLGSIWSRFVENNSPALTFIFYLQHRPTVYWKTSCMNHQTSGSPFHIYILEALAPSSNSGTVVSLLKFPSPLIILSLSTSSTVWQPWASSQRWDASPHTHPAATASGDAGTAAAASASEAAELAPEDAEILAPHPVPIF